jgi:WSC domain
MMFYDVFCDGVPNANTNALSNVTLQPLWCIENCLALGNSKAGVQNTQECWCGGSNYAEFGI